MATCPYCLKPKEQSQHYQFFLLRNASILAAIGAGIGYLCDSSAGLFWGVFLGGFIGGITGAVRYFFPGIGSQMRGCLPLGLMGLIAMIPACYATVKVMDWKKLQANDDATKWVFALILLPTFFCVLGLTKLLMSLKGMSLPSKRCVTQPMDAATQNPTAVRHPSHASVAPAKPWIPPILQSESTPSTSSGAADIKFKCPHCSQSLEAPQGVRSQGWTFDILV